MRISSLHRGAVPDPVRSRAWAVLIVFAVGAACAADADAQRPFRIYDPLYRSETARRAFYDGYALTGEISYRPVAERQLAENDPLGLSFRVDYELFPQVDLSAVFDASGGLNRARRSFTLQPDTSRVASSLGGGGRSITISWVVLKYYRTVENTDYAFRLAVDPASDGRVGFPQMDLAFIYSSALSPIFSTDFAIGMRRVRMGYEDLLPAEGIPDREFDVIYTRALGTEIHLMLSYNFLFDPAGSNVFLSLLGEGGDYELFESSLLAQTLPGTAGKNTEAEWREAYRGGVVWVRFGVEFNRPSYQLSPYLSVPVQQWVPEDSEWPQGRTHVGFRLMLR